MSTLALKNIGLLFSGNIDDPVLDADTILVRDGIIVAIGKGEDIELSDADTLIDAEGMAVIPGLIDGHIHPVFGDWTPRLKVAGWIGWAVNSGVTSMISAGEFHLPGLSMEPQGVKALAILAAKSFRNARPSGVKVHAGAVILVPGLSERDFEEMAEQGVWLVAEVAGSLSEAQHIVTGVEWARKYRMKVMQEAGGGTRAADILALHPDLVTCLDGGSTPMPVGDVERIVKETDLPLGLVAIGNPKMRSRVLGWLKGMNGLHRVWLGTDEPGGPGIFTMGVLKLLVEVSCLNEIPASIAIAMATGNTAKIFGLNTGVIAVGKEADFAFIDAPLGSTARDIEEAIEVGDCPAVAMVVIDGTIEVKRSRTSQQAKRSVAVTKR